MSYKKYAFETFYFTSKNGQEYSFRCFSQNTRYGFRHVCEVMDEFVRPVVKVSCPYYNRTWERFKYESALLKAARGIPQEHAEEVRAWVRGIGDGIRDREERKLNAFMQEYEKLPDSMKDALKTQPLETPEDADRVHAIAAMYNVITGN